MMRRVALAGLLAFVSGSLLVSTAAAAVPVTFAVSNAADTTSTSTRPLTFRANIGFDCVQGSASDGATISLTWKSAAGRLKGSAVVRASATDGRWAYCSTGSTVVEIGDL